MPLVLDNPVLDAYIRGNQERRQDLQTKFENQLQTEAGQRSKEQLTGYLDHLKAEHAHQDAQLELEKQRVAVERQSHELQARQLVGQMLSQGIMKPPTQSQANSSPVGGIQVGDQVIDPRQFSSPQELQDLAARGARQMGDIHAEVAGKTTSSQMSAAQPFEALRRVAEHQQEMEKTALTGKQAMERTVADVEGRKAVARINGQYDMDKARIQMFGGIGSPEEWTQTVLPYITGDAQKPLGNTPKDLVIRKHITQLGYNEFTAKGKGELQKLSLLDPIVNLQKEFIDKFAPNGNAAAAGQILMSKIPTTDLNNFKARLRSAGGTLAAGLDAQTGRMANQEIERVLGGLAVPGKTLGQAVQDLNFIRSRISSKALDSVMGSLPDKQKLIILKQIKRDPGEYFTNYGGKDIPRYKQDPADGEWLVFDPNKKGYVSVDAPGK